MSEDCACSRQTGVRRVCGLLGERDLSGAASEGHIVALREIIEHFQIEWEIAAQSSGSSEGGLTGGFALEMRGRHVPTRHSSGQPCVHCANLMLSLRIIEEWLLPPGGRCTFCQAEASSAFVRGDRHSQEDTSSTRTLYVLSGPGTPCQIARCHELCIQEIRDRLALLGAAERRRLEP
jgi:hypothetical protein